MKICERCKKEMEYSKRCSTKNTEFWYCRQCTIDRWKLFGADIDKLGRKNDL